MKQDSWLYSDSFLKRCFAIWGYHTVANLIIAVPFMILWFLVFGMIFASMIGNMNLDRMPQDGMMDVDVEMMP